MMYVKCQLCGNSHKSGEVETIDIESNFYGEDVLTFECPDAKQVTQSLVYIDCRGDEVHGDE